MSGPPGGVCAICGEESHAEWCPVLLPAERREVERRVRSMSVPTRRQYLLDHRWHGHGESWWHPAQPLGHDLATAIRIQLWWEYLDEGGR
jgi:hypothetical protein